MRTFLAHNKFLGFLCVGGFNTIMSLVVYAILIHYGLHYMLSSAITFIFGVVEGYVLNSLLVFKEKPHFKSLLKFFLVYCISLLLNLILMYVQVSIFHAGELFAQVITCGVLAIVNYYLIKVLVYRIKPGALS